MQRKDVQYAQLEETLSYMAVDVAFLYEIYQSTYAMLIGCVKRACRSRPRQRGSCANVTNFGAASLTKSPNIKELHAARSRQKHNFVRFNENQKRGKLKVS